MKVVINGSIMFIRLVMSNVGTYAMFFTYHNVFEKKYLSLDIYFYFLSKFLFSQPKYYLLGKKNG